MTEMKYMTYQSTEIPWADNIPAHWKQIRNGRLLKYRQNKVGSNYKKYELLSLTTQGIKSKNIHDVSGKVPLSYDGYQEVYIGDIVFCLFDLDCSAVFSGLSKQHGMITSAYHVMEPNTEIVNSRYLDYWYQSVFFGRYYKIYAKSIRYTINYDIFKAIKTPVPPRDEQDQIVRYLDWKTSQINKLIHGYKRQISLLKERRTNLIDKAVTKGVRPNRSMQNIPGNWMGDIPSDWRMIPSKRLFKEGKERKHPDDKPATASQKYGIIAQEDYMRIEGKRIVIATQGLDDWKHVDANDFVISLRSFQGGIEKSDISGCVTWHYIVLHPQNRVEPSYFKWLLKSRSYIKALQGTSEFIRDGQDLRYSNFTKIDLPLISKKEQLEISHFIETETNKIDKAIPVIHREIELLQEYRTSLISDVVTGQMDVRNISIPDYTPETEETIDTSDTDNLIDEEVDMDVE